MRKLAVIGGPLRAISRCRDQARRLTAIAFSVAWLAAASAGAPAGDAAPLAGPPGAPINSPLAAPPTIGGCQIFPADNVWNTRIDTLPVHSRSAAWINSIGYDTGLKADFGSGLWEGTPIGIPYTTAPGNQPPVDISFYYDEDSDPGQYRIPPDAPIEGGSDDHVLVVDRDRCILTEVFDATKLSDTAWEAGSGAFFNLGSNALRTNGWTSADAAGLPILPGLARYDEIVAGEIAHALRFTVDDTQGAYIWPARHQASDITDPDVPPMGARVRLKSEVVISGYPTEVRVILLALQRYGMFLADNGSNWYMSGVPDARWNNDTLRRFAEIKGHMLEFVDESGLMVDPDSGQVRTAAPAPPPPPPPSCSPRPAAKVGVARTVPGKLDVTVTPGVGPGAPNNRAKAIRFGSASNARVLVNGQLVAPGTRVVLPAGSTQARFTLERIQADQGGTVQLVLEDDCGDWSTFVGGGKAAW